MFCKPAKSVYERIQTYSQNSKPHAVRWKLTYKLLLSISRKTTLSIFILYRWKMFTGERVMVDCNNDNTARTV